MSARSLLDRVERLGRAVLRRGAPATHLPRWISNLGLRTVLDIGANTGQFAEELRGAAPEAQIYSFEPLPDCYEDLSRRFARDRRFRAFNVALGDTAGETVIHRSSHAQSSSLLPMGELHRRAFPYTADARDVKIQVERLDDFKDRLSLLSPMLAKLDVQGFEDRVIAGGRAVLSKADVLVLEMSVEPLYEGQKLFEGLFDVLRAMGFVYRGNLGQVHHPEDDRVLQVDAVFFPVR